MIDWAIEKKAGLPSIENVLECLVSFKQDDPVLDHSSLLFNKLAFELMKFKKLEIDMKNLDKIFEKMNEFHLNITI